MIETAPIRSEKAESQALLVSQVKAYVKEFMSHYDGSHDFAHIQRVLGLALTIATSTPNTYDLHIVTLSALLHDVGDKKYLRLGDDSKTMVEKLLLSFGANEALASEIQVIVNAVSYSNEITNPTLVQDLVIKHPELAAVQDADRLDAIGAIGIGRVFTYGGAHGGRAMANSLKMFEIKLEKLEGMMKTKRGREMAAKRTKRLSKFKEWWADEVESGREALEPSEVTK